MATEEPQILISVSKELNEHYQAVKKVRDSIINDPESSGQAMSAVINACSTVIKDLARVQMDLYNSNLIASLQQACYNALREVDPALQNQVMEAMERNFEQN